MTKNGDTSLRSARLDQILVERGLAATRSRARDLILRGQVSVAGAPATKPASTVPASAELSVSAEADDVSRGAVKLRAGLDAFAFSAAGRTCLDVGASTGGFTQALLAAGATRVYAADVGHGQLSARLAGDARVINLEGRDARHLTATDIPEPIDAIVADVSFISLTKVLPQALSFARPNAWLVALVKPQFEVGRADIGKGGIVRDPAAREAAVATVRDWLGAQSGWRVVGTIASPIAGGSGNHEFLLGARHD
jgi:23S rRNA (cytidine1920-2'-O)/16S rRNA (cytidine1409-2'-O)-methyltransferase